MPHKALKAVGGTWWLLIGSFLGALALTIFLLPPPYNLTAATLPNLWVIIGNPAAIPMPILIFLLVWALLAFGFFGGTAYRSIGKKRKFKLMALILLPGLASLLVAAPPLLAS